jgi:hypothetical protein
MPVSIDGFSLESINYRMDIPSMTTLQSGFRDVGKRDFGPAPGRNSVGWREMITLSSVPPWRIALTHLISG